MNGKITSGPVYVGEEEAIGRGPTHDVDIRTVPDASKNHGITHCDASVTGVRSASKLGSMPEGCRDAKNKHGSSSPEPSG